MPRGENRPGRFTQLDFDSLATVAEETPAEAVQLPDIQPFSGTRHKFVLKPGGIQYTLDAALSAQSTLEEKGATAAAGAGQDGARQPVIQPFSGTRHKYSLVPGGIQYTLDALFGQATLEDEAATSEQAERQQTHEHPKPAISQFAFDTLADLPSDDVPGNGADEHARGDAGRGGAATRRPAVQPRDCAPDGVRGSLGDSTRAIPAAGRGTRRDEPE